MDLISNLLETIQQLLVSHVFEIFKEPKVAIGLSALLLILGFGFFLVILWRWLPSARKLRRLEKIVRATDGELGFAQDFLRADESITGVTFTKHGWEEFKETLVLPDPDSNEPIRNTARPSVYLNLVQAEASGLHLKFLQAVPNYFVGAGLVFTFLGLVAAIYFASKGISAESDIQETQQQLRYLLDAATFKFLTSIAGILSSLLIAITYRYAASRLQQRFDRLCEALEERLAFATPESIAFNQFKELQKQTEQLERFNTDLAFSIAKELDNRLNQSLPPSLERALAPLAATMNNMADRFGEMNQDAISDMMNRFTDKLHEGAGAEMRALGDSLSETKETLSGLVGSLQSSSALLKDTLSASGHRLEAAASAMEQSFKEGISESAEQLKQQMSQVSQGFAADFRASAERFSNSIQNVSEEAGEILQPVQQHLGELTNRLDGLASGLDQQIQMIGNLNSQLNTLVQNTGRASERLKDAGEPVHAASQAISAAAQQISASSRLAASTHEKLSELAQQVSASVEETTRHWADYQRRFQQVDQDLANTFKELRDGTAQQQSVIREFVSGVDQELDKALRNLGAGVEGLQDNLEEFTAAVESLGNTFERRSRPGPAV